MVSLLSGLCTEDGNAPEPTRLMLACNPSTLNLPDLRTRPFQANTDVTPAPHSMPPPTTVRVALIMVTALTVTVAWVLSLNTTSLLATPASPLSVDMLTLLVVHLLNPRCKRWVPVPLTQVTATKYLSTIREALMTRTSLP